MAKKKRLLTNRTLSHQESLIGVFLALLIPVLSAGGAALPELTAMMLK